VCQAHAGKTVSIDIPPTPCGFILNVWMNDVAVYPDTNDKESFLILFK